jgi:hypothetical protein
VPSLALILSGPLLPAATRRPAAGATRPPIVAPLVPPPITLEPGPVAARDDRQPRRAEPEARRAGRMLDIAVPPIVSLLPGAGPRTPAAQPPAPLAGAARTAAPPPGPVSSGPQPTESPAAPASPPLAGAPRYPLPGRGEPAAPAAAERTGATAGERPRLDRTPAPPPRPRERPLPEPTPSAPASGPRSALSALPAHPSAIAHRGVAPRALEPARRTRPLEPELTREAPAAGAPASVRPAAATREPLQEPAPARRGDRDELDRPSPPPLAPPPSSDETPPQIVHVHEGEPRPVPRPARGELRPSPSPAVASPAVRPPPAPLPAAAQVPSPERPAVSIEIGRIEIRAADPRPAPPPRTVRRPRRHVIDPGLRLQGGRSW